MRSFQNKTVLLTGAAAGIGRQLAEQLADLGCHLYLVDVDRKGLESLADSLQRPGQQVWIQTCDLSEKECVSHMLADFDQRVDKVDVVINNAGVAYYGPTDAMTQQQWDWLMHINLLAPIQITSHLLPTLLTRPDAHIVNMCSISGIVAGGRFAAYHASKFGLVGYTEALRAEYGRKGIGVTAICPGPVKTNLYNSAVSGHQGRQVPSPPHWVCASAERVAALTIKGMRRNRRQVVITPMAHALFQMKRFMPGLIDFANQFSRGKRKRIAHLEQQEAKRLAALAESTQSRATHGRAA